MKRSTQNPQKTRNQSEAPFLPPGVIGCGWPPPQLQDPLFPSVTISAHDSESNSNKIESETDSLITEGEDAADLAHNELPIPKVIMTQATYDAVMQDLTGAPFRREKGGILIGPIDAQNVAMRYVKDENGHGTYASFTIDFEGLNKEIREVRREGLICVGIIHSHPHGICHPSGGDISFLRRIFANPKNGGGNGYFIFPIVAGGELQPYLIDTGNDCRVLPTDLMIV